MSTRRDSRTDEQRQADEDREREFHRQRREAGLPPLNYGATVTIGVRDVTDAEAERFHDLLSEAAEGVIGKVRDPSNRVADDRGARTPHVAGSTYTTERNLLDET